MPGLIIESVPAFGNKTRSSARLGLKTVDDLQPAVVGVKGNKGEAAAFLIRRSHLVLVNSNIAAAEGEEGEGADDGQPDANINNRPESSPPPTPPPRPPRPPTPPPDNATVGDSALKEHGKQERLVGGGRDSGL